MKVFIKPIIISLLIVCLIVFSNEVQTAFQSGSKFYAELEETYELSTFDTVMKFVCDNILAVSLSVNVILMNVLFNVIKRIYLALAGLSSNFFRPKKQD